MRNGRPDFVSVTCSAGGSGNAGQTVPIAHAAREAGARLVGLSALMATTVGAMERTIQLVHQQLPQAAVMVGGAVITQEFADQIGADFYAKDAAESTRVATQFFGEEA